MDLVVTRHLALLEYLILQGVVTADVKVVSHALEQDVKGQHVCGVLPHSLSSLTESYTEVVLRLPTELRGKELTLPEVDKYASVLVKYKVTRTLIFNKK